MRSPLSAAVLFGLWIAPSGWAQAPAPAGQGLAAWRAAISQARDLASGDLQAAEDLLNPLLAELRRARLESALDAQAAGVFQEALLLHISVHTKLLGPEEEILDSFRELLLVNPRIADTNFNPREKQLLEKARAGQAGRLSLRTAPSDAGLFYLGSELGRTPVELALISGNYRFVLHKQGYLDQEFAVDVRPSEILLLERILRRSTVRVPLAASAAGLTITVNGKPVGQTAEYDAWLRSLPPEEQQEMSELVSGWRSDPRSAGFFRLTEVPVEEEVTIGLSAPCYEGRQVRIRVGEAQVDWDRPAVVIPELRAIELTRDTGFLQVTSLPAGAEVRLDGTVRGKTPLDADVCAGTHRVQVLHPSGQFVQEVVMRRGQVSKVAGELKPALAFLGLYRQASPDGSWTPLADEWQLVQKKLALSSTTFTNLQWLPEEVLALRNTHALPLEALQHARAAHAEADSLVKKALYEAGKANLILFGLQTGNGYQLLLYHNLHSVPDLIEMPSLEDSQLGFLIGQLNNAERAPERLRIPRLPMELMDSPGGLAVFRLEEPVPDAVRSLSPGTLIRTVDRTRMTLRGLQTYLRTKKPGESVAIETAGAGGASATAIVPIIFSGAEYPWNTPESFPNATMAVLQEVAEKDPASEQARFARLSLALGLMHRGVWKAALEELERTDLEAFQTGVGAGTVHYYRGRCYEELGDRANSEQCYARAKESPHATLSTWDGLPISILAERSLKRLKKPPQ